MVVRRPVAPPWPPFHHPITPFTAQAGVAVTTASVQGAVLSMSAGVTLTVSSIRRPSSALVLQATAPYLVPVSLLSVSPFAVLAGSALVNTGASRVVGNVGVYPGASDQISVSAQSEFCYCGDCLCIAKAFAIFFFYTQTPSCILVSGRFSRWHRLGQLGHDSCCTGRPYSRLCRTNCAQ